MGILFTVKMSICVIKSLVSFCKRESKLKLHVDGALLESQQFCNVTHNWEFCVRISCVIIITWQFSVHKHSVQCEMILLVPKCLSYFIWPLPRNYSEKLSSEYSVVCFRRPTQLKYSCLTPNSCLKWSSCKPIS